MQRQYPEDFKGMADMYGIPGVSGEDVMLLFNHLTARKETVSQMIRKVQVSSRNLSRYLYHYKFSCKD